MEQLQSHFILQMVPARLYLLDLYALARNLTFNFFSLSQDRVTMLPNPFKPCELPTRILLALLLLLFLAKMGDLGVQA